ncbi:hypothetical protein [Actinoplanes xinjiangensis]|uniref:hypothetical protein n=1 Tax=Actinoplanes xinjiangensis TaxID=512350 RepID=UPI00341C7CC0
MSVSGVGPAHRPHLATGPAPQADAAGRTPQGRNDFAALTDTDRALIEYATGQKIGLGFDPHTQATSIFAVTIAADRATGRLSPGQKITVAYLTDRNRQYEQTTTGVNPFAPYLAKALEYLNRHGRHTVDVNA